MLYRTYDNIQFILTKKGCSKVCHIVSNTHLKFDLVMKLYPQF